MKVAIITDQHFGAPNIKDSRERERIFMSWLNHIQKDNRDFGPELEELKQTEIKDINFHLKYCIYKWSYS